MIKALLNGILKMIINLVDIFLLPINALFANLFPDMSTAIGNFNTFIDTYIGGSLGYFFSLFPPIFRSILVIWLTFLIAYYTFHYGYVAVIKIWNIIQKIKFW